MTLSGSITIALTGNPNSGKTTVFNAMTGARQHIANYPGVTVEKKSGKIIHKGHEVNVVDLPGTYSLTAYSVEEIVARDFLINERPDVVVDIVDGSNLDRNLYLAVQIRELGIPLVVALNMMDVAESRGTAVDCKRLSELLEVPVVPMVARSKVGIQELLDKVIELAQTRPGWKPATISYGSDIDISLDKIAALIEQSEVYDRKYPARWRALKCLEGDNQMISLLKRDPVIGLRIEEICKVTTRHIIDTLGDEPEAIITDYRYGYIAAVTRNTVKRRIESRLDLSDKIDKVLTNRFFGPIIMMGIFYAIYAFTFWASEEPMNWLETFFSYTKDMVNSFMPEGVLQSLIVSGIIDGLGGVLGFVPLIMCMFFAIAILEDSGYMARMAYMLDRVMRWFGLHGNSVMAMIVSGGISGGCAVPGVLATRTLMDPKERIATLLVVPFMNCGAKLPVFAMLIAAFFSNNQTRVMFLLTILAWAFALLSAKLLRSTVLRGPKTPFVMELPPYRLPTLQGLLIHTWERTAQYVKKAGTVILGFSILLWAAMTFPGLPQEKEDFFKRARSDRINVFLKEEGVDAYLKDEDSLKRLEVLISEIKASKFGQGDPLLPLAMAVLRITGGSNPERDIGPQLEGIATGFLRLRIDLKSIEAEKRQNALGHTVAGRLGRLLEHITKPLGFDYRVNISLIGGFAAKEVILSTLGTAYSLSDSEQELEYSLQERLRNDPGWNPLKAITLIVFVMLYVPCMATLMSIRKETSWMWVGFSLVFNLTVAYLVAMICSQAGRILGLGV
ncbi:MAG: ferrous iron transport protein B [Desulfobacteraceae bacterium]|nr:MAG: ferrous iron transport protein B [Desulfobacteraceae bacterium]